MIIQIQKFIIILLKWIFWWNDKLYFSFEIDGKRENKHDILNIYYKNSLKKKQKINEIYWENSM